jgi:hypothetical protein
MPRKTNMYLAAAVTAAALLAGGCGGSAATGTARDTAAGTVGAAGKAKAAATPSATTSARPKASATPTATPTIDPGTLPQTSTLPGDQDAQFKAGAQDLWQAIVQDKPELARPFFFPLSAYQQVKAIWNPAEDYQNRLIAWYGLDIQAAHDYLGSAAANARFVGISVPEGNAAWIEPGVEYNKGSYYRVYGTRLNYEVRGGHEASIGVFSLISWRGEWYVVHLGPSTRSAMQGFVYDPWN